MAERVRRPVVTVRPADITFEVDWGDTVFAAAVAQHIRWPTTCEGEGTCRLCVVQVLEGREDTNDIDPLEAEGLAALPPSNRPEGSPRLACQLRPRGDLTLFKRGVKRQSPSPELKTRPHGV